MKEAEIRAVVQRITALEASDSVNRQRLNDLENFTAGRAETAAKIYALESGLREAVTLGNMRAVLGQLLRHEDDGEEIRNADVNAAVAKLNQIAASRQSQPALSASGETGAAPARSGHAANCAIWTRILYTQPDHRGPCSCGFEPAVAPRSDAVCIRCACGLKFWHNGKCLEGPVAKPEAACPDPDVCGATITLTDGRFGICPQRPPCPYHGTGSKPAPVPFRICLCGYDGTGPHISRTNCGDVPWLPVPDSCSICGSVADGDNHHIHEGSAVVHPGRWKAPKPAPDSDKEMAFNNDPRSLAEIAKGNPDPAAALRSAVDMLSGEICEWDVMHPQGEPLPRDLPDDDAIISAYNIRNDARRAVAASLALIEDHARLVAERCAQPWRELHKLRKRVVEMESEDAKDRLRAEAAEAREEEAAGLLRTARGYHRLSELGFSELDTSIYTMGGWCRDTDAYLAKRDSERNQPAPPREGDA